MRSISHCTLPRLCFSICCPQAAPLLPPPLPAGPLGCRLPPLSRHTMQWSSTQMACSALPGAGNRSIGDALLEQLRPGSRVVTYMFRMPPSWEGLLQALPPPQPLALSAFDPPPPLFVHNSPAPCRQRM